MKTTRLVFGIITFVLCIVVLFQSCAVGIHNSIENNGDRGGSAGFFVFVFMIVSGVLSITVKSRKGGFTTSGFYFLAGIIAILNSEVFKDLSLWGMVNLGLALVIFIMSAFQKEDDEEYPIIPPCAQASPQPQIVASAASAKTKPLYCGQCGNRLEEGNRFCVYCGAPIPQVE